MCGVLAIFDAPGRPGSSLVHAARAEGLLDRLAHRGPDERSVLALERGWLGHRRLAIVDLTGGAQPFRHDDVAWAVNGEIYNHETLRQGLPTGLSGSDAAVIGPRWREAFDEDLRRQQHPAVPPMLRLPQTRAQERFVESLDGQFAFVAIEEGGHWIAARDPFGICPLYLGRHADGSVWFASEMKALVDDCEQISLVEPGTLVAGGPEGFVRRRWYRPRWRRAGAQPVTPLDPAALRGGLVAAVEKRLMSDVPMGLLLSGGVDSSLIASIAVRLARRDRGGALRAADGRLHSFCIGLEGAPDLEPARRVARSLGLVHHEFTFTIQEALDAIPAVVAHLESWEQIRTAVPTYLLAQRIRESGLGIKSVLSGEGADEIFGGYLYFHRAPGPREFFEETVRKLTRLHLFDVMRSNKAPMAHGLEVRVPFLDRALVDLVMELDPREKLCDLSQQPDGVHPRLEKYALRKAFDDPGDPWLPEDVLWRGKEQFSDGVGYSWVDALRERASLRWRRPELQQRLRDWGTDAPPTDELRWMRELFEQRFCDGRAARSSILATVPRGRSIACSTPEAMGWDPSWESCDGDISGRAIRGVHAASTGFEMGDKTRTSATASSRSIRA